MIPAPLPAVTVTVAMWSLLAGVRFRRMPLALASRDTPLARLAAGQKRGYMMRRADENKVARFVRF